MRDMIRIPPREPRRRHSGRALPDARQFLGTGIDAAAGLGDASDMLDRRLSLEIFQLDAQAGMTRQLFLGIATDIAFALEDVEHAGTQL
jgi:hypothetical protein